MAEYIEREKLLGIEKLLDTNILRESKVATYIYEQMLYDIENIPASDIAPVVHGKWIIDEYEYFTCSNCKESYYNGAETTSEAREILDNNGAYNYCPHCGAKMDLEDEKDG